MGDLLISSGSCHDELQTTTFYAPPHEITHRQAGPWQVVLVPAALPLGPAPPGE
jgi:hypothetical protein